MDSLSDRLLRSFALELSPAGGRCRPVVGASATLALVALIGGCSMFGQPDQPPPLGPEARLARIASLREAIAEDHERLIDLVTAPRTPETEPLHEYPEIKTIAERLTVHELDLARLEALELEIQP